MGLGYSSTYHTRRECRRIRHFIVCRDVPVVLPAASVGCIVLSARLTTRNDGLSGEDVGYDLVRCWTSTCQRREEEERRGRAEKEGKMHTDFGKKIDSLGWCELHRPVSSSGMPFILSRRAAIDGDVLQTRSNIAWPDCG